MPSFRLICVAALTAASAMFAADVAAAQTAAGQPGNGYLAGLPPPHEHKTVARAKATHAAPRPAATKIAQPATKRRPTVTATVKRRPARLADKINSDVAWPNVEPRAADEATIPTVLQFANDDAQAPVAPPPLVPPAGPPTPAAAPTKILAPPKVAADERKAVDSMFPAPPATTSTPVQTERFEPPASQMRVILPAQSEAPVAESTPNDQQPARSHSIAAQLLTTLAGAIAAGVVGWLMIGFGSVRTFRTTAD